MEPITSCDGQDLCGMFGTATRWLERNAQAINALNVFPVPDGDTGTNMLLTMRAAMEEANRCSQGGVAAAVAQALARGALMGARGNSGVILSQILRGWARALDGKNLFDSRDLLVALAESSSAAYKGVSKPVEGTILTVIREAAAAAEASYSAHKGDIIATLEATVVEARASVARTPSLLDVLRDAGVVDAGGQGLYLVLEGVLSYLKGEAEELEMAEAALAPVPAAVPPEETQYGYCTEFLLQGTDLDQDALREKLCALGESVMVVGDDSTLRAHLHTFDPGAVLSLATSLGTLHQVKVDNMQDQHRDFIAIREEKAPQPPGEIALVAVASGEGLVEVFSSLGTAAVVPGGETMNPSVQQVLEAVNSVPANKVIVLPNNPNVVMAAEQARQLTEKEVAVVPTETVPQGIAAVLAFSHEADLKTNASAMEVARTKVRSGELTTAIRSMELGGLKITKGQAIAFLDRELVVAADSMMEAVHQLLPKMGISEGELVAIYYGVDASPAEVEELVASIRQKYPEQEVEVVGGGQPHYNYLLSVE